VSAPVRTPVGYNRSGVRLSWGGEVIDYVFLVVTGVIAYHGITYRDEDGESDTGHLLFGCIALVFFLRVLLVDILKLV